MTTSPSNPFRLDITFIERFIGNEGSIQPKLPLVIVVATTEAQTTSLYHVATRLFPGAELTILSDHKINLLPGSVQQIELTADRDNQLKSIRDSRATAAALLIEGECLVDFSRNEMEITVQAIEPGGHLIVSSPKIWRQAEHLPDSGEIRILPSSIVLDQFIRALSRQGHVRSLAEFSTFTVTDHFIAAKRPARIFSLGTYEGYARIELPDQLLSMPRDSVGISGRAEIVEVAKPGFLGDAEPASKPFKTTMSMPEMHVARLSDVVICPRQLLIKDDALLPDSFRRYRPRDTHIGLLRDKESYKALVPVAPLRIIEDPVFYLDGEHAFHFGHFLLEVLPRAWALGNGDLSGLKILVNNLKPFQQEILAALHIDSEQILMISEPILARDIFIAGQAYVLEQYGTSQAFELWSKIGNRLAGKTGAEKIYISRSKFKDKRNLIDETVVEDHLRGRGYEILYPETMTFAEQVTAFRNAKRVVGTSGSAMYNCVFNQENTKKLFIAPEKFISVNDMIINTFRRGTLDYFLGQSHGDGSAMRLDWTIDLDKFRAEFDQWQASP